jgi:hypothetical protein
MKKHADPTFVAIRRCIPESGSLELASGIDSCPCRQEKSHGFGVSVARSSIERLHAWVCPRRIGPTRQQVANDLGFTRDGSGIKGCCTLRVFAVDIDSVAAQSLDNGKIAVECRIDQSAFIRGLAEDEGRLCENKPDRNNSKAATL